MKEIKHVNYEEVRAEKCDEGKGITIRWLITDKDGAENFAMRLFEVEPEGNSPWHQHDWEHEVFILDGEGALKRENGEEKFKQGDVLFVPPMVYHQFKNTGKDVLKFLCMVPYK